MTRIFSRRLRTGLQVSVSSSYRVRASLLMGSLVSISGSYLTKASPLMGSRVSTSGSYLTRASLLMGLRASSPANVKISSLLFNLLDFSYPPRPIPPRPLIGKGVAKSGKLSTLDSRKSLQCTILVLEYCEVLQVGMVGAMMKNLDLRLINHFEWEVVYLSFSARIYVKRGNSLQSCYYIAILRLSRECRLQLTTHLLISKRSNQLCRP